MTSTDAQRQLVETDPSPSRRPYVTIRPPSRWVPINVRELWHFHDLLMTFAGRDVKLRYRQTLLGGLWVILQPLAGAGIFTVVFGRVAHLPSDGVPYFLFAYMGLLAWNAFSQTLTRSSISLLGGANLIAKIYFPRLILPLSVVFSTLIDSAVALAMGGVLMALNGVAPGPGVLLLPVWFLLLLMMAMGIGLTTSALNVSYRDVGFVVPVVVQFLLFASPVAYAVSAVPHSLHFFYLLNPLTGLLEAFRWSILGSGHPDWAGVVYSAVASVVLFVAGGYAFKSLERKFADVI
jgi:lipopolysaccharide transport system permease protein